MINNAGEICGQCQFMDGSSLVQNGFLLSHGKFSTFKVPNSSGTSLNCITDNGKLSGEYFDKQTPPMPYAFIATPRHGHK